MKIIRVRYVQITPLREDLERAFPTWDGTREDLTDHLENRHAYIKVYRNEQGQRTHADVYMLVKDTFSLPNWVQGTEIKNEPHDHEFLGHSNLIKQ